MERLRAKNPPSLPRDQNPTCATCSHRRGGGEECKSGRVGVGVEEAFHCQEKQVAFPSSLDRPLTLISGTHLVAANHPYPDLASVAYLLVKKCFLMSNRVLSEFHFDLTQLLRSSLLQALTSLPCLLSHSVPPPNPLPTSFLLFFPSSSFSNTYCEPKAGSAKTYRCFQGRGQ